MPNKVLRTVAVCLVIVGLIFLFTPCNILAHKWEWWAGIAWGVMCGTLISGELWRKS